MAILPFGHPLAESLIAGLAEEERYSSMHLVSRRGRVRSGGDAVIALDALFPDTRGKAWLDRLWPPRRRKVHEEYDALAARRSELSERVPDIDAIVIEPRVIRA